MLRRSALTRLLALAAVAGAALAVAPAVLAQVPAPKATAEVTKIDKAGGRISLKHGEIKNLDMPPMTMVFRLRDPKMLDGLAVGDRVLFAADRIDGNYTVTEISKQP